MKSKALNYTVLFKKEQEGGYTVTVPVLPGCVSYGENLETAKKMAEEAILLYIESLETHKEEVPTEEDVFYTQLNIPSNKSSYV